jgi:aryl-alcohol dehydrogenase-like predicted oxidoreductase
MKYNKLGTTDVKVSAICLGSMTFGEQNSEAEGHQQLDFAIERGVNFIDTAELYSIPPKIETYGSTETIIGSWIAKRGRRDDIVLASKIAGGGFDWVSHIREGKTRFSAYHIKQALEASLKRLRTDYIDLYQLHWPERNTNYFGRLNYKEQNEQELTPIDQTLRVLQKHVQSGKIRYIGLSNETPWGIMQFLTLAKQYDLPVIASVQNPYNLLNRSYEIGCAEISHREKVCLLAYSPLGFGVLSGKYLNGNHPAGARMTLWPNYSRYTNPQAISATQAYVDLAKKYALDPAQMALAFVNSRPFITSSIIGATTIQQLENNIASIDVELSTELLDDIELIHQMYPNPAP